MWNTIESFGLLDPVYTVPDELIWDRSEIRPFSPVYTRIRPVRGSQIRLVPWFSCVYNPTVSHPIVRNTIQNEGF